MHVGKNVHFADDVGNWRDIDLNWRADIANPGEFVTDQNDIHTRITRFGVAVWDRKRRVGLRWSTTVRPTVGGNRAVIPKDGLAWTWIATASGLKLESEPVTAPRGPQAYEWRYLVIDLSLTDGFNLLGTLTADAGGNLVGDGFVTPRSYAIGANGLRYDCGPWQVVAGKTRAVAFDFDDSALPPEAFPYVIDPTTTFAETAGADDGRVFQQSDTYPPTGGTVTVQDTQATVGVGSTWSATSPHYFHAVGLFQWDTSSLPDTATINAANFQFSCNSLGLTRTNPTATFYGEWYVAGTIDASDYTTTIPANPAFSVAFSAVLTSGNDIATSGYSNGVSLTGYTGLRLQLWYSTPPTGSNTISIDSFETIYVSPKLIVTYTDSAPAGFAATASALASTTATMALLIMASATAGATAAAPGALTITAGMQSTPQSGATTTAALSLAVRLQATVPAGASTVAPLSSVAVNTIAGIVGGAATASATLALKVPVGATAASASTGSAGATLKVPLAGTNTAQVSVTATATVTSDTAGTGLAGCAVLGVVAIAVRLASTAQAGATATVSFAISQAVTATGLSQASSSATLLATALNLSATAKSEAGTTGAVSKTDRVWATASGWATAFAAMTGGTDADDTQALIRSDRNKTRDRLAG